MTNGHPATFDRTHVVNKLRGLLTQAGITGHYSGHSFRQGAATWARQAGIPDDDIQLLGRWESNAYKCYIEVHPEYIHNVSRRLQSFSPQNDAPRPIRSQLPPAPSPSASASARGQHIGGLGRAGRGAGEPGLASGAASLAGSPPAVHDEAATVTLRSRTSLAPRLRHPHLRHPRGSIGGIITARGKRRKEEEEEEED